MIRLAIAEDHQSLIDGIKLLLKYEEDIEIVGTANDGERLLEIVKLKEPNVVITDIRMPKMDGITVTKEIKKVKPHTKILGFTMFDQTEAIEQMLDAGASGYLLKNSPLEEVLKAVRAVVKGDKYFDSNLNFKASEDKVKKPKGILTHTVFSDHCENVVLDGVSIYASPVFAIFEVYGNGNKYQNPNEIKRKET